MKKRLWTLLLASGLFFAAPAFGESVTLSADSLRYDLHSGKSVMEGHVVITQGPLKITANKGEGASAERRVILSGAVQGSGPFEGAQLTFSGQKLIAILGDKLRCSLSGGASLRHGNRSIKAEKIDYNDESFAASKVSDLREGDELSLVADSLQGKLKEGQLVWMQAFGGVKITSKGAQTTVLSADQVVYEPTKDELMAKGNAVATQEARSIKAKILRYQPSTGIISADGRAKVTMELEGPSK